MKKFKKFSGFVFALLVAPAFMNVQALDEIPGSEAIPLSEPASAQEKSPVLSLEATEKIKLIVKEQIDKFYAEKNKQDVSEEIAVLNQKLEKERKRCAHYRHKLHAKKAYVSPRTMQSEIDKAKAQLILEFNRYMADYVDKSENKDKKLRHLDLGKIFSNFINLNVTFTNPKEVNFNPSLIRGEAKASVVGAGIAV